jgi:hypothetical protein
MAPSTRRRNLKLSLNKDGKHPQAVSSGCHADAFALMYLAMCLTAKIRCSSCLFRNSERRVGNKEGRVTMSLKDSVSQSAVLSRSLRTSRLGDGAAVSTLYILATVQFIWFYLSRVPSCLDLLTYEAWRERTPFQYRLLMVYPLRWAHHNALLVALAAHLTRLPGWFPRPVHPEGILEAVIDLVCVATAGVVARRIYQAASRTRALAGLVYPLTLAMAATTYAMLTISHFRFVYDLPSLALFSIGLYLIYFHYRPWWFVALFTVATLNRETSLFLLVIYAIDCSLTADGRINWRNLIRPKFMAIFASLSVYWVGWHLWVVQRFAANPVANTADRLLMNVGVIGVPLSWPQILALGCYCVPLLVVNRGLVQDPRLRAWYWVLPVWFLFMMRYGLMSEIRLFGELIPYFACLVALICECKIERRMKACTP